MPELQKREIREYQTDFGISKFIGRNTFGEHSNLVPGEFRDLQNLDINDGGSEEDYLKTRRGSQYLRANDTPVKFPDTIIKNAISWDIGAEEYSLTQVGNEFYYQALLTPADPVKVLDFDGSSAFALASTVQADLVLDEDRLLIFHEDGNKVIEWDSDNSLFKGRNMGMKRAYIRSIGSSGGNLKGRYVYAIEKCYQVNSGDVLCSGVNRLTHRSNTTTGGEYARTGLISDTAPELTLSGANFFAKITFASAGYTSAVTADGGRTVVFAGSGATGKLRQYDNTNRFWWVDITSGTPLVTDVVTITSGTGTGTASVLDLNQQDNIWTHIKLWRTKNLLPDLSDEDNPIEPGGTEDDMWLMAIITKAEMEVSGLTAIATSTDEVLPSGNNSIEAGLVNGEYTIHDGNGNDDPLISLAPFDSLELLPVPSSALGAYHKERIWTSQVNASAWDNGVTISDVSQNEVYYSPEHLLWYKEQSRTDFHLETQKDGQKVTKLISIERDLVVTKEDKTMRLPDGDVTLGFEVTDHTQGILHANFGLFAPELGLVGITSDFKDCKIYGFDHIWRNTLNGIDIARANRAFTENLATDQISMVYINGKILLSDTTGNVHVLHVEQKRGWSRYEYPNTNMDRLIVFAGGTRCVSIGQNQHSIEIEVKDLITDVEAVYGATSEIDVMWLTHMFRSGFGRHVIEHEDLSIMAKLTSDLRGTPFVNGQAWPGITTEKETNFFPSPSVEAQAVLMDREYKLYLEPETLGNFLWNRLIGNFVHYRMETEGDVMIKTHKLNCIVDEDGNASGQFDPFQNRNNNPQAPVWVDTGDIIETGTATVDINETGTQTEDISEVQ